MSYINSDGAPQKSDLCMLKALDLDALQQAAAERNLPLTECPTRWELLKRLAEHHFTASGPLTGRGVLQVMEEGYGFLRHADEAYQPSPADIYVGPAQIRRLGLQTGHEVCGQIRPPKEKERNFVLLQAQTVQGRSVEGLKRPRGFYDLTPIYPERRMFLESTPADYSLRAVDLMVPLGKGQRALIVSPPKAGKTMLLQQLGRALFKNNPELHLMVLLLDERPAEVTDFRRTVPGEILASTFDEDHQRHCRVAEMALERAKRMVEAGRDVAILLDSLTRLTRAYNLETVSGKITAGGLDAAALSMPKKLFGAARNLAEGGSLTIIATALVETGTRMDDSIYEEFKGTGDCEIHLDRRLANRHLYPAIDLARSGTRKDDLLLHPDERVRVNLLRRHLQDMNPVEAVQFLIEKLGKTKSNVEFLLGLQV